MQPAALIPVPFTSLKALISTASRYCGRASSVLRLPRTVKALHAGDVIRLALLAPEVRFPIDINATVVARTFEPTSLVLRYELADLAQVECALGQLYAKSQPMLPMALEVATFRDRPCRLSYLSPGGATFDVQGEVNPSRCTPDAEVKLSLPHQLGPLELPGQVAWVTPRPERSRIQVRFAGLGGKTRQMLEDIVFRFRLGAAPWRPRLLAPGL